MSSRNESIWGSLWEEWLAFGPTICEKASVQDLELCVFGPLLDRNSRLGQRMSIHGLGQLADDFQLDHPVRFTFFCTTLSFPEWACRISARVSRGVNKFALRRESWTQQQSVNFQWSRYTLAFYSWSSSIKHGSTSRISKTGWHLLSDVESAAFSFVLSMRSQTINVRFLTTIDMILAIAIEKSITYAPVPLAALLE